MVVATDQMDADNPDFLKTGRLGLAYDFNDSCSESDQDLGPFSDLSEDEESDQDCERAVPINGNSIEYRDTPEYMAILFACFLVLILALIESFS